MNKLTFDRRVARVLVEARTLHAGLPAISEAEAFRKHYAAELPPEQPSDWDDDSDEFPFDLDEDQAYERDAELENDAERAHQRDHGPGRI